MPATLMPSRPGSPGVPGRPGSPSRPAGTSSDARVTISGISDTEQLAELDVGIAKLTAQPQHRHGNGSVLEDRPYRGLRFRPPSPITHHGGQPTEQLTGDADRSEQGLVPELVGRHPVEPHDTDQPVLQRDGNGEAGTRLLIGRTRRLGQMPDLVIGPRRAHHLEPGKPFEELRPR